MNEIKNAKDDLDIPKGMYCYDVIVPCTAETNFNYRVKPCRFWSLRKERCNQMNGYCSFLELGDWDLPTGFDLLWDQVKVCGINNEDLID